MKKCRHKKLLLGTVWFSEIHPDQEPYKADEIEPHDPIPINETATVHYCEMCERIVKIDIDE